jgi:hypothetical protein
LLFSNHSHIHSHFLGLHTKLNEETSAAIRSDKNPFPFFSLPFAAATWEAISSFLQNPGFPVELLYFYHKECRYTAGVTPLALYLPVTAVSSLFDCTASE